MLAFRILAGDASGPVDVVDERWISGAVPILAALTCFVRGRRAEGRLAWSLIGAGILAWGLADLYDASAAGTQTQLAIPSLADTGYVGFYVAVAVGLALLVRAHVSGLARNAWLDGVVVALTIAALVTNVVFEPMLASIRGSSGAVAASIGYPLADGVLLAIVLAVASAGGPWLSRTWVVVGAGICVFAGADVVYLHRAATGTYHHGMVLDLAWRAAMLLLALASTMPSTGLRTRPLEGRRLLIVPTFFASIGLALAVADHFMRLQNVSLVLISAALGAVIVRMALTFNDYLSVLAAVRDDSVTDALTGLGNRRALLRRLTHLLDQPAPHLLLLFDLDGFKSYNDRFGHAAGDALLTRLAGRLARAVGGNGVAYRLGGDEFCALVARGADAVAGVLRETTDALSEKGDAFDVSASCGVIVLPAEARDPSEALRLADRRMYQQKASRRGIALEGRGVLLKLLALRDPLLATHANLVARVSMDVARRLDLDPSAVATLKAVAELHDIGKIAIPDAILEKRGPLSEDEWRLVRQHSLIGERIVNGAPGLDAVGEGIRSTHERWDGTGYPDGIRGRSIPITARVVAVANAYAAMTSPSRPYGRARSHEDAVAEVVASAGGAFDPCVVDAFVAAMREDPAELAAAS